MPPIGGDYTEEEQRFFDEYFREELRNRGRWFFEKIISENGELFKQDLDATVAKVSNDLNTRITGQLDDTVNEINAYLKEHVTKKMTDQLTENQRLMKEAQDAALETVKSSAKTLEQQHRQLALELQKSVADQGMLLHSAFEDNKTQIQTMRDAQGSALQWLNTSAQALGEQHRQIEATLQKNIVEQQNILLNVFESNMARVVEKYVLDAVGDQYDLKAQLPSIIKQMEANKQAMVDDIKL